jgi:hypothetical protein
MVCKSTGLSPSGHHIMVNLKTKEETGYSSCHIVREINENDELYKESPELFL